METYTAGIAWNKPNEVLLSQDPTYIINFIILPHSFPRRLALMQETQSVVGRNSKSEL